MTKPIQTFQLLAHGYDNPQYFPGCGIANTEYDAVYTGLGDTLRLAIDDALNQIAEHGEYMVHSWDDFEQRVYDNYTPEQLDKDESGEEWFYYFSIRVR